MAAMAHLRSPRATVLTASVTGIAVAGALCLSGTAPARGDDLDCGGGAVFIVGGTNDPEARHLIGVEQRYTGIGPDNRAGTADDDPRYSGAGRYRVVHADYPTTIWPLGAAGYDDSTAQGIASTARAISAYQADCGGKPVVVAGYSQGARVAGDVLADIGTSTPVDAAGNETADGAFRLVDVAGTPGDPSDDVLVSIEHLSGELYADPRQAGDKTGRGIELSLIGIIPGLTMSGPRSGTGTDRGFGVLDGDVVSVCVEGDPICDLPDPLHDPIGAMDGLLGYFTKHNLYPYAMWRDPSSQWSTRPVECDDPGTTCTVGADSAVAELVRGWVRDLGITGDLGNVLAGRPTLSVPFGIELANLQPVVRLIQGLLPPLPRLGYGAYLPDLFVFEDILHGIVTLSPARFAEGVTALAASVRSIVLLPVGFVRFWTGALVGPRITVPQQGTAVVSDVTGPSRASMIRLADNAAGEPVVDAAVNGAEDRSSGATTPSADESDDAGPGAGTVPADGPVSVPTDPPESVQPEPDQPEPGQPEPGQPEPVDGGPDPVRTDAGTESDVPGELDESEAPDEDTGRRDAETGEDSGTGPDEHSGSEPDA
ncbi:PE-PPE domain-containing protein [Gordonia sp. 'Campus']|uniref:PE-PPE domain-containing protein n=1 Tax=Gordonia sp. 'Campus' TaxID=2915824 RepID=UPI001EE3DC84|nr:PE-PPE domain-containing protein [Gordonia sp. 'Campus']